MAISTTRPSKKTLKNSLFEENKARLNCEMEKTLYKRIQLRAIEEERTVSKITRQLWLEYLDKVEKVEQPENL